MSKARKRAPDDRRAPSNVRRRRRKFAILLGVGSIVALGSGAFLYFHPGGTVAVAQRQEYAPYQGPLLKFPAKVMQADEQVREVYQFAATHPEVLHYMPCYCGCWRQGHRDNYDCFIDEIKGDGTVDIDDMGFT